MANLRMLVLIAALALSVAACGGDGGASKEEYERGMRAVAKDFSEASEAASKIPPDADAATREDAIRRQQRAMQDAARRAEKLDPPEEVEQHHERLVAALGDYADLLGRYAEASGDSGREAELLGEAGEIVEEIREASAALDKAGYEFEAK